MCVVPFGSRLTVEIECRQVSGPKLDESNGRQSIGSRLDEDSNGFVTSGSKICR